MLTPRRILVLATLALLSGCGGHSATKAYSASALTAAPVTSQVLALGTARAEHESILLPTGEVFVVGGVDSKDTVLGTTELVSADGVSAGPTLSSPRLGHTLTLLSDGRVLIAGGVSAREGEPLSSTEVFDPRTQSLRAGPELNQARAWHATFVLSDAVIVAGGQGALGQGFGAAPGSSPLTTPVGPPASVDGVVLLDTFERVRVLEGTSEVLPLTLSTPQRGLTGVAISPLQFVLAGGEGPSGPAPAEVFDGTQLVPVAGLVARSGAAVAFDGQALLVIGGEAEGALRDDLEAFDGLGFQPEAPGLFPRREAAVAVSEGAVILVGGRDAEGVTSTVELLTPGQVAPLSALAQARSAHTFTLDQANTTGFAIGGYDERGFPTTSIELVDVPPMAGGLRSSSGAYAGPALEVGIDGEVLGTLLRSASGAKCSGSGAQPAASRTAAYVPGAELAALLIRIADAPEPTQAELLALPAQPQPQEFIDRLAAALNALGVQDAQTLAEDTRPHLSSMCAVSFPGHDLKAFLKHYAGKSHPAKDLLIARTRIFKGLEETAAATRLGAGETQTLDATLRSLAGAQASGSEARDATRQALSASAGDGDLRGEEALKAFGQVLASQGKAAQPVAPTGLFPPPSQAATINVNMANPALSAASPTTASPTTPAPAAGAAGVQAP